MAINDAISLEYHESQYNVPNGTPKLDENGLIPSDLLPTDVNLFVGTYADLDALQAAHPTGTAGQYAIVSGQDYYWNTTFTPAAWTGTNITATDYLALTAEQKASQPWIIVP